MNQPPWKRRRKIPDPQVKDAADQYEVARMLLAKQPPGTGLLLPLLNVTAVAIELYLKCLSAFREESKPDDLGVYQVCARPDCRGHRLVDLLEALPVDVKSDLETAYQTRPVGKHPTLRDALVRNERLFEISRYPYEPGNDPSHYDLAPLMELSAFLSGYVGGRVPDDRIEW